MRPFFTGDYWVYSRQHELGLLFVAPLWLLYEALAYQLNQGWLGSFRTGTDFLIKETFGRLGLHPGLSVLIAVFILILYFQKRGKWLLVYAKKPLVFVWMFLESFFYAIIFGMTVGGVAAWFLTPAVGDLDKAKLGTLVVSLGSGPYEEFVFRFAVIVGLLALLRKSFGQSRGLLTAIAVLLASFLFAAFHYLAIFGEPLTWQSFVFRFLAGIALSLLFIFRGFGITTYTHSFYNILLMFR